MITSSEAIPIPQSTDSLDTLDSIVDRAVEQSDYRIRIDLVAKEVVFLAQALTALEPSGEAEVFLQKVSTLKNAQPSRDVLDALKQLKKEAVGRLENAA